MKLKINAQKVKVAAIWQAILEFFKDFDYAMSS